MTSKTCFKCKQVKSLDEFYKHPQMADGHLNKCKECNKNDAQQVRSKRLSYYRAYDRERGNRQTAEYRRKYNKNNPIKAGARAMVNHAVRAKKLAKPNHCSECNRKTKLHGHHDDYSKPLEVRWLCAACHQIWHAKHGEALNG